MQWIRKTSCDIFIENFKFHFQHVFLLKASTADTHEWSDAICCAIRVRTSCHNYSQLMLELRHNALKVKSSAICSIASATWKHITNVPVYLKKENLFISSRAFILFCSMNAVAFQLCSIYHFTKTCFNIFRNHCR